MRNEMRDRLEDIFRLFGELLTKETGLEYLETVLRYIAAAGPSIEDEVVVVEALQRALPGRGEPVASIVDRWIEQGLQEGMRRGRRESIVAVLRARLGEGPQLERVARRLEAVEDLGRLGELVELVARVDSLDAFVTSLPD